MSILIAYQQSGAIKIKHDADAFFFVTGKRNQDFKALAHKKVVCKFIIFLKNDCFAIRLDL